jgi:putative iron-only hydrogenase system regulator
MLCCKIRTGEPSPCPKTERGERMGKRVAVIGAILEEPREVQLEFNNIVSQYKEIIKGRMGIPFDREGISVVAITVLGELDKINSFTGKLGNIKGVSVKTSISKKEI